MILALLILLSALWHTDFKPIAQSKNQSADITSISRVASVVWSIFTHQSADEAKFFLADYGTHLDGCDYQYIVLDELPISLTYRLDGSFAGIELSSILRDNFRALAFRKRLQGHWIIRSAIVQKAEAEKATFRFFKYGVDVRGSIVTYLTDPTPVTSFYDFGGSLQFGLALPALPNRQDTLKLLANDSIGLLYRYFVKIGPYYLVFCPIANRYEFAIWTKGK